MKSNLKWVYICSIIIALIILVEYKAESKNNFYQVSRFETTNSSSQFSIPACSNCDSASEPICSGTTSPQCPLDDSASPSCQFIGNLCSPSCPGTVLDPNTGFPVPATPFCNTKYLIIDGLGAGIQIFSTSDNPLKITTAVNSTTFSDGLINSPDQKCPGADLYFDGTIFNYVQNSLAPEPCGFGHVVIFNKLPERLSLVSKIITSTEHARSSAEGFFHLDYGTALNEVIYYSNKLNELKNLIAKSKDLKSAKKKTILRKIELIVRATAIAKSNLSNLANAQSKFEDMDPNQRDATLNALSKAQDTEVEIFKILLKFDKIQ